MLKFFGRIEFYEQFPPEANPIANNCLLLQQRHRSAKNSYERS